MFTQKAVPYFILLHGVKEARSHELLLLGGRPEGKIWQPFFFAVSVKKKVKIQS